MSLLAHCRSRTAFQPSCLQFLIKCLVLCNEHTLLRLKFLNMLKWCHYYWVSIRLIASTSLSTAPVASASAARDALRMASFNAPSLDSRESTARIADLASLGFLLTLSAHCSASVKRCSSARRSRERSAFEAKTLPTLSDSLVGRHSFWSLEAFAPVSWTRRGGLRTSQGMVTATVKRRFSRRR